MNQKLTGPDAWMGRQIDSPSRLWIPKKHKLVHACEFLDPSPRTTWVGLKVDLPMRHVSDDSNRGQDSGTVPSLWSDGKTREVSL